MEELKKPVKVELHVIPINIQNMTEGEDSVDGCMETRKKEMLSRNKSAISSACLSRRSFPSRRCFTAVERPKRSRKSCQACAYHDVKQIEQDMEGQQNVLLYGFHRSKSEMDVHSNVSSESFTTQFLRERSQVFLTHTPAEAPQGRKSALGHLPVSREEVSIAKTTVPKKGLIKLTALDNELKDPLLFERKGKEVSPMEAVREQQRRQQKYEKQRKMLIRRKDIMNQVNIGSLHLAEEKEKHDLEMQIENYTLGDLHRNINELTSTIKHPSAENVKRGWNSLTSNTKTMTSQPRGLALPAINTINLF
ncbi:uncharacterized protein LOC125657838 [Ostrea edulis]|uniref:uncharacterized protein LOC125657838 n=1 Tax=Ostrea edulis TaxID=37623 RepID=UPI0024AECEB0|nr:uncharacterized protein LOC125657838 [Ostrea edulis]